MNYCWKVYFQGLLNIVKNFLVGQGRWLTHSIKVCGDASPKSTAWPQSKERNNPLFDGEVGVVHGALEAYTSGKGSKVTR